MPTTEPITDHRRHILEVAADLFYRCGFRATGIDTVIASAKVAKRTLYHHFHTKDDLIAAVLAMRQEEWFSWIHAELDRRASTPREALLAMFDVLYDSCSGPFRGCIFFNAAIEFPQGTSAVRRMVRSDVEKTFALVRDLATAAGAPEPDALARELGLLRRGATMTAVMTGEPEAFLDARRAAETLLARHLPKLPGRSQKPVDTHPDSH
jgi:AcrR family transcriptional regulator